MNSGDGDGQGGLACCNSWGRKESDTTERLNRTDAFEIICPSSVKNARVILMGITLSLQIALDSMDTPCFLIAFIYLAYHGVT